MKISRHQLKKLAIGILLVSGVYGCYSAHAFLFEKLLSSKDGTTPFPYPIFITTCVVIACCLVSGLWLLVLQGVNNKSDGSDKMPKSTSQSPFHLINWKIFTLMCCSSIGYIGAMIASTSALPHVGLPTQIVLKSAKMIPILIGGLLFFRKKYPWYDYGCVIVITSSLVSFYFLGPSKVQREARSTALGYGLCGLSLAFDMITGPCQDQILAMADLQPAVMMFVGNMLALPIGLAITLGIEGTDPLMAVKENPCTFGWVILATLCSALGQTFLVMCIKLYGSLVACLITTLRKATSTFISVIVFKHYITPAQWASGGIILSTLVARSVIKMKVKQKRRALIQDVKCIV